MKGEWEHEGRMGAGRNEGRWKGGYGSTIYLDQNKDVRLNVFKGVSEFKCKNDVDGPSSVL